MFASGFAKPIMQVTFEDLPSICQMVRIHSSVLPVKAELDHLKEGLSLQYCRLHITITLYVESTFAWS